ncbi:MAG: glycosyltransferase, partial [Cyanobacteria bacterium J06632_3]
QYGYCQKIQSFYDRVLVVGMRSVFDVVQAYRLPLPVAHKVRYCGYIRKPASYGMSGDEVRSQLGLGKADRLVLVTPGGGEDGHSLVHTYLQGIQQLNPLSKQHQEGPGHIYSLILSGPEMPSELSHQLHALANTCAHVKIESFTREIFPYLKAADTIVSMGGYNTLTEILSLGKRAIVLPRTQPSKEQLIRASRFSKRDWVKMLRADQTTPAEMMQAVIYQLNRREINTSEVDFGGLARVLCYLRSLVSPPSQSAFQSASCQFAERRSPMPVTSVPALPVNYPPNPPPTNSPQCATA